MRLLDRLTDPERGKTPAPIEHVARGGVERMPKGDRSTQRMADRAASYVLDPAIPRESGDPRAGRLEEPNQAAGETGKERMLKVSFPPRIECNPAAGQIEALDPRALACE